MLRTGVTTSSSSPLALKQSLSELLCVIHPYLRADIGHAFGSAGRRWSSSGSGKDGKNSATSEIVKHKAQLTQAERAAGGAARARAEAKAAAYLRQQASGETIETPDTSPFGEVRPPWEEPPPEFGLAGVAERSIQEAMRKGAFDKLSGKGKPLKFEDDHTSQFYTVDSGQAVMNKVLKNANYRPASIELRDELAKALEVGRANLALAARAALAADARGGAAASGCAALRSGRGAHEKLGRDFEALNDLVRQYNNAVLADRESFGAFYPLHSRRLLSYADEVEDALRAAEKQGGEAPAAAG